MFLSELCESIYDEDEKKKVARSLAAFMAVYNEIDEEKNHEFRDEGRISSADSKVEVWVVPTNEELTIARDTMEIVSK